MTDEIKQSLRQWLVDKRKIADPSQLADDTALLDSGMLRSIDVADLLIYIEFMRERPIDISDLQPGVFGSINSIAAQFFPGNVL